MAAKNGALTLTSDDVNYLVYRYMQESGFHHASFTFAHESQVHRTSIDPNLVPAGALVAFIQKGMQYMEMEANIEDGVIEGDFTALSPRDLMTKDVDELRQLVQERRERAADKAVAARGRDRKRERPAGGGGGKDERQPAPPGQQQQQQKEREKGGKDKGEEGSRGGGGGAGSGSGGAGSGPAAMEEDGPITSADVTNVTTLRGHDGEVFTCAFSPTNQLVASGSGDATARIWDLTPGPSCGTARVLDHPPGDDSSKGKDVTTLEWDPDGNLLATGAYDGKARVWTKEGRLKATLERHTGPVFALRWNKRGDLLLTSSADESTVVWEVATSSVKQQFSFHGAAVLDADWRNATQFATCSSDNSIHLCKLGSEKPIKTWTGHTNEVNAVRWDPAGKLLASCSDDATAKVWQANRDAPVHSLTAHAKEVYTLKWSPTGPQSANPGLPLLLATASFDGTAKIWDAATGACQHTLQHFSDPDRGKAGDHSVYSVAWAPAGRLLATGSIDGGVRIWSVPDGALVRKFDAAGGVFEVCWDKSGGRLAVSTNAKVAHVLDLRY
ncbi:MAG: WD40 repeat-like protein [Monoraphidium minutum]|nr:MAG: WD40 repeat-like protein [Monoraphidium minutum]